MVEPVPSWQSSRYGGGVAGLPLVRTLLQVSTWAVAHGVICQPSSSLDALSLLLLVSPHRCY